MQKRINESLGLNCVLCGLFPLCIRVANTVASYPLPPFLLVRKGEFNAKKNQ
jgi:hypothetical protein